MTFVQRAGSSINLNVHLHSIFIDGVFAVNDDGKASFFHVPPPTDDEILVLVKRICVRVSRFLEKKGYELNDFSDDPFAHEQPAFAQILGASVQSRIGIGERAGQRVRRIGEDVSLGQAYLVSTRCALCDGFSLHANSDGTTHVLFDPVELVEKVVSLVPPPRANLLRYSGILASNSKIRSQIVPAPPKKKEEEKVPSKEATKWADLTQKNFFGRCPSVSCLRWEDAPHRNYRGSGSDQKNSKLRGLAV